MTQSDTVYTAVGGAGGLVTGLLSYGEILINGLLAGAAGAVGAFLIKRFILDRFSKK